MLKDDQPLYSGTAIVVMAQQGPLLVTCRHLVTGRNQATHRALSPSSEVPNRMKIAHNRRNELGEWVFREEKLFNEDGTPRWAEHPTLCGNANIVALPLQDLFDIEFFPYDLANTGPDMIVGLTDPVNIVGYPFGMRSGMSFPIWATGFIASEPAVDQFDLPTFLIDCRSRPGQAGSAVVAHSNGGSMFMSGGEYKKFTGPVTKLLGIFSGRLNKQSDLGIVWRVSAIREVVEGMGNTITQHQQLEEASGEEAAAQTGGRLLGLLKGLNRH